MNMCSTDRYPSGWGAALAAALLLAACGGPGGGGSDDDPSSADQSAAFPWNADSDGKKDVFGRSLVGPPNPYEPNLQLQEVESELEGNRKKRREAAWKAAKKILQPVPLLGLKQRAGSLPGCPEAVEKRDLENCADQASESACTSYTSNGESGICEWNASAERCEKACDELALPEGNDVPKVPRWQTWYGVEDINRIFKKAYSQLSDDEQVERAPLTDAEIGRAFHADHTAVDRSNRWPLWRYTDAVDELYDCPLEKRADESQDDYERRCARARQSKFSGAAGAGGGIARIMYSPAMVLHTMRNYGKVLDCRNDATTDTWCGEDESCEDPPDNFTTCFKSEFPADAGDPWDGVETEGGTSLDGLPKVGGTVLIKAKWKRAGFDFQLNAYDTDAEAMEARIGSGEAAKWREEGQRVYEAAEGPDESKFPEPSDIYTIKTRNGDVYRLTGLHIMTKELRHWFWISLWWSDKPDKDFGADRPSSFDELPSVWSNYKMCSVVAYRESDPNAAARFDEHPSLQKAIEATGGEAGKPTWCSNPYIEDGAGNARTNCIGCHQHAGTRLKEKLGEGKPGQFDLDEVIAHESSRLTATNRYPANGRIRRRTHFPTDYAWSFRRVDNLTELIRNEVEYRGSQNEKWQRRKSILQSEGTASAGETVFRQGAEGDACVDCHGENGRGDGVGPDLKQRFGQKTDWQLLNSILDGPGPMPAWGDRLSDEELSDLMAYLRKTFD